MGQLDKVLEKVLSGTSDANINFTSFCNLITKLGFVERIKGDHFIYAKEGVDEILNIQPKNSKAKPYQVKQVRSIIVKYKMGN
jgi:hypothetical protein